MINNSEFAERLRKIMDYHRLSASAFADRIQVQRSSISHLLSGRNKPSLDFVMKVVKEFEGVELYWLLNGKGIFPATSALEIDAPSPLVNPVQAEQKIVKDKNIERIVVFYNDGTFKAYLP